MSPRSSIDGEIFIMRILLTIRLAFSLDFPILLRSKIINPFIFIIFHL